MIVDDNSISARVNQQSLLTAGYIADTAEDGTEALDKLQTQAYDLILMDYQLPQQNGFETASAIREWELNENRRRHIILTFTAAAEDLNADQAYAAGVDAVLSRSLAREDLLTLIDGFLSSHSPLRHGTQ